MTSLEGEVPQRVSAIEDVDVHPPLNGVPDVHHPVGPAMTPPPSPKVQLNSTVINQEQLRILHAIQMAHPETLHRLYEQIKRQASFGDNALVPTEPALQKMDKNLLKRLKKCVVNIEQNISHALNSEKVGVFTGTGFIVDKNEGIIATNYHITGTSPQQVKITFENGESTEAVVLHYDAWHDFAFYKCNPKLLNFPLEEATLGDSFSLEEQAEVFLIGNNDDREYSIKYGTVTNLIVDTGKRHSHSIQTSFDRTSGSSGSPVFDINGHVVGIHTSGTNTTSFELRVEYIKDALKQLQEKTYIQRGDIGVELALIRISDAVLHFNFPQETVDQLKKFKPELKYIPYINRLVPLSPCKEWLKAGDMVFSLDNQIIADNLYMFDRLVDLKVNKTVDIVVYRNGIRLAQSIQVVDVEKTKIKKFALFAGGVFHDITPLLRSKYEIHTGGTFLSQVIKGSCFTNLGSGTQSQPQSYATLIEEVSGMETPNLDAFISAVQQLLKKQQKHIYVLSRNLRNYRTCTKPKPIILDLKFNPLRVFEYSEKDLNWVEVPLNKEIQAEQNHSSHEATPNGNHHL